MSVSSGRFCAVVMVVEVLFCHTLQRLQKIYLCAKYIFIVRLTHNYFAIRCCLIGYNLISLYCILCECVRDTEHVVRLKFFFL